MGDLLILNQMFELIFVTWFDREEDWSEYRLDLSPTFLAILARFGGRQTRTPSPPIDTDAEHSRQASLGVP